MREQRHESDEELAACIEAYRTRRALLQYFRAIVQLLDQLEHGSG